MSDSDKKLRQAIKDVEQHISNTELALQLAFKHAVAASLGKMLCEHIRAEEITLVYADTATETLKIELNNERDIVFSISSKSIISDSNEVKH